MEDSEPYDSRQKRHAFFFSPDLALLTEELLFADEIRYQIINNFSFSELIDLQKYLGDRTIDSLENYARRHSARGGTECSVSSQQTLDKMFLGLLSMCIPVSIEVQGGVHQELVEYVQRLRGQKHPWGKLQVRSDGNNKKDIIITNLPKPTLLGSVIKYIVNTSDYYTLPLRG